jgi:alpha-1,6-mannosyltransferase
MAAGYGWGWLGPAALRIPTQLRVLTTPVVSIGTFLWGILHLVGLPWSRHATVTVVQVAAELAAALGIAWLLFQSGRYHPVRLLGCALLLFVACSPTVWPWYWTWPLAILAATGAQRSRALAVVAGLAMVVVGAGGTPMLTSADWWVSGPILLVVLGVVATGGRWRSLLGPVGGDRPVVTVP